MPDVLFMGMMQREKIRAIFWDNDGVLVDTEGLYYSATQQILASAGVMLSKEQYIDLILVQGKGAWHLVREQGIPPDRIEQLRNKRDTLYAKLLKQNSRVMEGAQETLASLHGRYIMGIVTSSKRGHFELIHRESGLLQYFDFILTGGDYKKFKPDPEPYLLAVERSGCRKEECVAIEDSERGLRSAKSAGIGCFVIPTALTQTGDFSQADRVLKNIQDVPLELAH